MTDRAGWLDDGPMFIELMEGLEVAESTVKLLVGHKRTSMTTARRLWKRSARSRQYEIILKDIAKD